MPRLKITVLRTSVHHELAAAHLATQPEKCPDFTEGQEFVLDNFRMPAGFCTWAWQDMFYAAHTLWNGGSFQPWYRENGVVVVSCTDGLRPVLFRIERLDNPAGPDTREESCESKN